MSLHYMEYPAVTFRRFPLVIRYLQCCEFNVLQPIARSDCSMILHSLQAATVHSLRSHWLRRPPRVVATGVVLVLTPLQTVA